VRILVCLLVVVASCGDDKPAPGASGSNAGSNAPVTSPPSTDDEVAERALSALGAIADLAAKHGKNCDALAAELALYAKQVAPMVTEFKKLAADPAKQQAIAARYGERIQQVGKKAVESLRTNCGSHPKITNVFKQL
jgi:hypothetical protein